MEDSRQRACSICNYIRIRYVPTFHTTCINSISITAPPQKRIKTPASSVPSSDRLRTEARPIDAAPLPRAPSRNARARNAHTRDTATTGLQSHTIDVARLATVPRTARTRTHRETRRARLRARNAARRRERRLVRECNHRRRRRRVREFAGRLGRSNLRRASRVARETLRARFTLRSNVSHSRALKTLLQTVFKLERRARGPTTRDEGAP